MRSTVARAVVFLAVSYAGVALAGCTGQVIEPPGSNPGSDPNDPNNPNNPTPEGPSVYDEDGMIKKPLEHNPDKFDEMARALPGIRSMMGPVEE